MDKKSPLRMCVGCREMKPKREMLRIVKNGDDIALDLRGKAPGRGAYICDNPNCIKKCAKSKLLNKTFKCAVDDGVYESIRTDFENRGDKK